VLETIVAGERVVLIGTGLTMADVAITLAARGVELSALSRHGLAPLAHAARPVLAPPMRPPGARRPVELMRELRAQARRAADWRDAVDGLRPFTADLWQALPLESQAQFLRHAQRHWEAHRHRMAPETGEQVAGLLAEGRLALGAGSLVSVVASPARLELAVARRHGGRIERLEADRLVNCTGPAVRIDRDRRPLVRSLLERGLARPDAHGLGFAVASDGRLVGGRSVERSIFALGALRRGTIWETTAIPEIRGQAEALAAAFATVGSR
jgi:uncharacterized NAD(P)/FAD-binding protein YdhS